MWKMSMKETLSESMVKWSTYCRWPKSPEDSLRGSWVLGAPAFNLSGQGRPQERGWKLGSTKRSLSVCFLKFTAMLLKSTLHTFTLSYLFLTVTQRLRTYSNKNSNKAKHFIAEHIESKCLALRSWVCLDFFAHFLLLHERGFELERNSILNCYFHQNPRPPEEFT